MTRFGRTGFEVSELCLGTSSWGTQRHGETEAEGDARVAALGDRFFAGAWPSNIIDTSNIYGNSRAEGLVGRSIAGASGQRERFILQTKLDRDVGTGDFSAGQMWRSLEQSLDRLGTDRVDVLFLHDPNDFGFEASMAAGGPVEALLEMRSQGLASAIGISDGPLAILNSFVKTGAFDALITHNRFTLIDRSADQLLDLATSLDMAIENAAPFGGGILTGAPALAGTYGYLPVRRDVTESVASMARACDAAGVPLAAAALQFSLRDTRIHTTIVGASSTGRFARFHELSRVDIPGELWLELEALAPDFELDSLLN